QDRWPDADLADDVAPQLRLARAPDRLLRRLPDVGLEAAGHVAHAVADPQLGTLVLLQRALHDLCGGIRRAHPSLPSTAASRSVSARSSRRTSSSSARS